MYCGNPSCPLATCTHIHSRGVEAWGTDQPVLYLVGEAPGGMEDREGVPFIGPAGKLLRDMLRRLGIDQNHVRINNTVRCAPWNEKQGKIGKPNAKQIEACLPSLYQDIARTRPRVIVALGGVAMKALTKLQVGITTVRGNLQTIDVSGQQYPCMPTLHPASILPHRASSENIQFFMQDLKAAWDLAVDGGGVQQKGPYDDRDYGILSSLEEVQSYVDYCVNLCRSDPNAFITADFEAGCLQEWRADNPMLGLGISHRPYQGRYIPMEHYESPLNGMVPQLSEILRPLADIPMANQHIGFDYQYWRRRLGIELREENIHFDPMLAHHTLFAGSRPNDLETMGGLYLQEPAWSYKLVDVVKNKKTYFKAKQREAKKAKDERLMAYWQRWSDLANLGPGYAVVPLKDLALYCCIDVDVTWRLVPVVKHMLQEKGLLESYKRNYHDAIKTFADMQYDGIAIDNRVVASLRTELPEQMSEIVGKLTQTKEVQKTQVITGKQFNLGSPQQVSVLLYDVMRCPAAHIPGKSPRTTEDAQLQQLLGKFKRDEKKDKVELLEQISQWRSLGKYLSSYVLSNVTFQDPRSGLVHPNWNLMGTRTGRMACDSPPVHSAPVAHGLRRQYFSRWHEDGGVLLGADESQIEVRIFASLAEDATLIDFYCNRVGADLHRYMASLLYDVPYEAVTTEQRRVAKTCVFASLYGGGPGNLASQTGMEMAEARKVHGRFTSIVGIEKYAVQRKAELAAYGGVHTPFGLFLPIQVGGSEWAMGHAMRQALNSPIQSAASSTVQAAILRANKYMKQMGFKSKIVIFHHDAIYWDVYPGELFLLIALAQHVMVTEPMQMYPWLRVPLKIGIEFGSSWGQKIEFDTFTQDSLVLRFEAKKDEESCYQRYQEEVVSQFEGPMGKVLKLENLQVSPQEIIARVTAA